MSRYSVACSMVLVFSRASIACSLEKPMSMSWSATEKKVYVYKSKQRHIIMNEGQKGGDEGGGG